jgi:hypothetical protein
MDAIAVGDAVLLVRDLRAAGMAESTIAGIYGAASRVFKFARRYCSWRVDNPLRSLTRPSGPE